jgi:hypothetical protein
MESRIRPVFTIYFNRQIFDYYQLRNSIYTCSSSGECWNAVNAASSEKSSHLSELKPHTTIIVHIAKVNAYGVHRETLSEQRVIISE